MENSEEVQTKGFKQFVEINATAFSKILKKASPFVFRGYPVMLMSFSGIKPPRSGHSASRHSAPADSLTVQNQGALYISCH